MFFVLELIEIVAPATALLGALIDVMSRSGPISMLSERVLFVSNVSSTASPSSAAAMRYQEPGATAGSVSETVAELDAPAASGPTDRAESRKSSALRLLFVDK